MSCRARVPCPVPCRARVVSCPCRVCSLPCPCPQPYRIRVVPAQARAVSCRVEIILELCRVRVVYPYFRVRVVSRVSKYRVVSAHFRVRAVSVPNYTVSVSCRVRPYRVFFVSRVTPCPCQTGRVVGRHDPFDIHTIVN